MQLIIKSVRSVKTGTNKKGEWELISVVSQKGTEYTTFDKKVKHLGEGSVIEIGEPDEKDGKLSFKKVEEIITEVPAQAAPAPGGSPTPGAPGPGGYKKDAEGIKLEYELRGVLQGRERVSIEGQSTLAEVGNMIRAGFGPETVDASTIGKPATLPLEGANTVITTEIVKLYQKAATVALEAFIRAHDTAPMAIKPAAKDVDATRTAQPAEKSTTGAAEGTQRKLPEFKDGTALVNAALAAGWRMQEIRSVLKINVPADIKDVPAATAILYKDLP